ncbi:hypothetical protein ACFQ6U_13855 [Streptomyces sp. NPDC056465]|uniref:hypothetical protein n=1 Tax=Streptomyces sp. NPDC056465 TaxID=3345829 RepID=UPI0036B89049
MVARMTAAEFTALMARRAGQSPAPAPKKPARKKKHPGLPSVPEPPELAPLLAGLEGVGRTWTLLMPYVEQMLTSNLRLHWRPEHTIRKQLREHAVQMAHAERLPKLQRAAIFYVLHPRSIERSRDPGNWSPTAKAYIDGLVTPNPRRPLDRHLLPDDDHTHLLGPNPVMGSAVPTGYARMSLVIVEVQGT